MKLKFTQHVIDRMVKRNEWVRNYKKYKEVKDDMIELSRRLKVKGIWWMSPEEDRFYCVLSQLSVYCGVIDDDDDATIVLTTYYPYTQKVKGKYAGWERYHFVEEQ